MTKTSSLAHFTRSPKPSFNFSNIRSFGDFRMIQFSFNYFLKGSVSRFLKNSSRSTVRWWRFILKLIQLTGKKGKKRGKKWTEQGIRFLSTFFPLFVLFSSTFRPDIFHILSHWIPVFIHFAVSTFYPLFVHLQRSDDWRTPWRRAVGKWATRHRESTNSICFYVNSFQGLILG